MAFQDDKREIEIREIFGLVEPENRSRQDTDAVLQFGTNLVEFELKSTREGSSVTTARDVGYNHLEKWKSKHWIIGIYDNSHLSYAIYIPPRMLLEWISEKEEYIRPDFEIANILHKKITIQEMYKLLGKKDCYSYEDAKALQKNQLKKEEYLKIMDKDNGYSPKKMLSLIHDRAKYLILRGYTLNNPHIPSSIIEQGYRIDKNHASELKKILKKEI